MALGRVAMVGISLLLTLSIGGVSGVQTASTNGGVTFQDIAVQAGINYSRVPSTTKSIFDGFKTASADPEDPNFDPYTFPDIVATPEKADGAPGVAVLDYDNDGDLDIYVTNGPGANNSLFANQLQQTGQLTFNDVGAAAGVGAADQDSTGTCFGDIDNDGDHDLMVLGRIEYNRLFENQGNGTFTDITSSSGVGGGTLGHTSCSMGDVNGDSRLDIFVSNSFDWTSREAIFVNLFASSHHNQLFLNTGGNQFSDVSDSSGIRDLAGYPPAFEDTPTISWATALVDYDLDGDIDILTADDQAAIPQGKYTGGFDRGFVHVFQNDGTGNFTDVTVGVGTNKAGQWMGLSFADFNCDGQMDFFGTNMGDYAFTRLPIPYEHGDSTDRWFLGQSDGTFSDPGVGGLVSDPFGWGTSAFDYDNDGDTDVVYYGHLLAAADIIAADNPGSILRNDGCNATFERDANALAGSTNHHRRGVQGVAAGDINNDGFVDIITVSSANYPEPIPLTEYAVLYGSAFDAPEAVYVEQFSPFEGAQPGELRWNGHILSQGTLSIELNSADNGNNWASVSLLGTAGITPGGSVNRDGIGATVSFTPRTFVPGQGFVSGDTTMQPVLGGSSYASQDSLPITFGLGAANRGRVDVLWPGGVRNRLYNLLKSERITFPEIPCSFDASWEDFEEYSECVEEALEELEEAGFLTEKESDRFMVSAVIAFFQQ